MVAGALARLGKLGDGSARRDIVAAPVTVIEALARGLAEAIIVIVQVDGLERLAVFSLAHVPAISDVGVDAEDEARLFARERFQ